MLLALSNRLFFELEYLGPSYLTTLFVEAVKLSHDSLVHINKLKT